jgi:hypothetical protein
MLHQFHELDLLQHLNPRSGVQLHLVNDLDCYLLPGKDVTGQLDDGVVALANRLLEVVQTSNLEDGGGWRDSSRCLQSKVNAADSIRKIVLYTCVN